MSAPPSPPMTSLLDAALAYAAQGWPVFPLKPNSKRPITEHGFYNATTDAAQIRAWWRKTPAANIGVPTGVLFYAIDEDLYKPDFAYATLDSWRLPPTLTNVTPHGGLQELYTWPESLPCVAENRLAQGVCFKGVGGYIVVPPSVVDGKAYRWDDPDQPPTALPERMAALVLDDRPPGTQATVALDHDHGAPFSDSSDYGEYLLSKALALSEDGTGDSMGFWLTCQLLIERKYDLTLDVKGRLRRYADAATLDASHPFTDADVRRWIASAERSKLVMKGERAARPGMMGGASTVPGINGARTDQTPPQPPEPPPPETPHDDAWRPTLQSLADLMVEELPAVRWIVEGLIPEGVTLIGSKAKKGKTALMMHVGCSVAGGSVTLGSAETEQVEVLYLALEDNKRRFQKRIRAMLEGREPPAGFYFVNEWLRLDRGGLDALKRQLDEQPSIGLIIVDTLEHIRPARKLRDGVYADDYGALRDLQRLAGERQIAIVALHHLRKAPAEDPFDEFNGSMGLMASTDNAIVLRPVNGVNGVLELHRRGRDYEDDTTLAIKGDKRTLLWSLTGEAQEAFRSAQRQAIVDLLAKHPQGMRPKEIAQALGKNDTTTRRLLQKLLNENPPPIVNDGGVYTVHTVHGVHTEDGE